ncbi:MAG TPA: RNA polymerase sigma factor [Polyangia bacterium]|jgi:RNA polymerase sigma-70 factor (ECF subfamily)
MVTPAESAPLDDDCALTRAAAAGDPHARTRFVTRVLPRTRNLVRYLVRDDVLADDLAQAALIEALRSVGGYRGDAPLERWVDRITVRTTMAHLRRSREDARVLVLRGEPADDGAADPPAAADPLLRRRLAAHLGRLKEERRVAVVMKVIGGFSLEEIAAVCEAPLNTIKDRLRVGREELRASILADPALAHLARGMES